VIVDAHTHVIPSHLVDALRSGTSPFAGTIEVVDGRDWVVHGAGYRYPLDSLFTDSDARLGFMDERGVDASVVSLAPPFFGYELDAATAIGHAAAVNDALAAMVASNDRLFGLATLPMQDPGQAAHELERAMAMGLSGVQIGASVAGTPVDHESFHPVLAAAEQMRAPVVIHPAFTGPVAGLEDHYMTNLCGNPWQTCVCAARLVLGGSLDRFGELEIMLVHAGGHLPYQMGRLDHGARVRDDAGVCVNPPSSYLTRFSYDTLAYSPTALGFLIDVVGADRVLYGTDAPFDMDGGTLDQQLDGITLSGPDRQLIAGANAGRLFGIQQSGMSHG